MTTAGTKTGFWKSWPGLTVVLAIWAMPALVSATVPDSSFAFFWTLVIPIWLSVPLVAVILSVVRLFQRNYAPAARLLLFPLAFILIIFYAKFGGDWVLFELHRSQYDRAVAQVSGGHCTEADRVDTLLSIKSLDCGPPLIVVFPFGHFLSMWHGVVYDQSDEFGLPEETRSAAWSDGKTAKWLSCSAPSRSLGNHYYLAGGHAGRC